MLLLHVVAGIAVAAVVVIVIVHIVGVAVFIYSKHLSIGLV